MELSFPLPSSSESKIQYTGRTMDGYMLNKDKGPRGFSFDTNTTNSIFDALQTHPDYKSMTMWPLPEHQKDSTNSIHFNDLYNVRFYMNTENKPYINIKYEPIATSNKQEHDEYFESMGITNTEFNANSMLQIQNKIIEAITA